jgi:hypothetical protein
MAGVAADMVFLPPGPRGIVIPLGCALFVLCVAAAIDASRKPKWAFDRAGKSRWFWIIGPFLGSGFFFLVGTVIALYWFASVRPRVVQVMSDQEHRHSHTRKAKRRAAQQTREPL